MDSRDGQLLTRQSSGIQAWKVVIEPIDEAPRLRIHEGYEWLDVLAGHLRLVVVDHDTTMDPGT